MGDSDARRRCLRGRIQGRHEGRRGKHTYADGSVYEGEYKAGKKEGRGKYTSACGDVYEGEYKELAADEDEAAEAEGEEEVEKQPTRLRHGTGTYTEMGNTYQGAWEEDKMTGQGKFSYASKAVYEGQWKENKYDGEGKYTWPDGSSYEVSACRSEARAAQIRRRWLFSGGVPNMG